VEHFLAGPAADLFRCVVVVVVVVVVAAVETENVLAGTGIGVVDTLAEFGLVVDYAVSVIVLVSVSVSETGIVTKPEIAAEQVTFVAPLFGELSHTSCDWIPQGAYACHRFLYFVIQALTLGLTVHFHFLENSC